MQYIIQELKDEVRGGFAQPAFHTATVQLDEKDRKVGNI
jgi:hypothetical protein